MVLSLKMSFLSSFFNDRLGHYAEVRVLSKDDPGMFPKPCHINLVMKLSININARVLAGHSLKFPTSTKCIEENYFIRASRPNSQTNLLGKKGAPE